MRKLKLEELNRDTVDSYQAKSKAKVTIVLDNVRSGHNVGSVFRTCDAFAFERIILAGITPRPPHKEINKTAIGATLSVDWQHEPDIVTAIQSLKDDGYVIYGIEQTTESKSLADIQFDGSKPIALVFGNEVNGISDEVIPLLDHAVEIEQHGTKHSLNVSVCAGVVMWEVRNRM